MQCIYRGKRGEGRRAPGTRGAHCGGRTRVGSALLDTSLDKVNSWSCGDRRRGQSGKGGLKHMSRTPGGGECSLTTTECITSCSMILFSRVYSKGVNWGLRGGGGGGGSVCVGVVSAFTSTVEGGWGGGDVKVHITKAEWFPVNSHPYKQLVYASILSLREDGGGGGEGGGDWMGQICRSFT